MKNHEIINVWVIFGKLFLKTVGDYTLYLLDLLWPFVYRPILKG